MKVLSLFDGISCGRVALERAGIKVDKYYASEIDKYAMQVAMKNYPDTIQLGDVEKINFNEYIGKVDLLIGGSPCQGFSFAGKQLNFMDPRSRLFFKFVEVLEIIKPKYFLLENVKMKKEYQDVITKYMGVEPIEINSSLVSAQNRKRLYWTNILGITQPQDKGILLKDILHENTSDYIKVSKKGTYKKHQHKASCLTGGAHSGGNHSDMDLIGVKIRDKSKCVRVGGLNSPIGSKQEWDSPFQKINEVGHATDIKGDDFLKRIYSIYGKSPTLTAVCGGNQERKIAIDDYLYRRLTPIECERLQTLLDNYTAGISNSQRYKCLGNGWTVDIIAHIFKHLEITQIGKVG